MKMYCVLKGNLVNSPKLVLWGKR